MAVGILNIAAGKSKTDDIIDNDLAGSIQIWHAQMILISIPARPTICAADLALSTQNYPHNAADGGWYY